MPIPGSKNNSDAQDQIRSLPRRARRRAQYHHQQVSWARAAPHHLRRLDAQPRPIWASLRRWKAGEIAWKDCAHAYTAELFLVGDLDAHNRTIKNRGQKFTLRLIKELARRQTVTLLCQCAEEEQHCHRHVLQKLILSNLV